MSKSLNEIGTDVYGVNLEAAAVARKEWDATEAAANDADAVLEAVAGKTSAQNITENIVNPPCVRTLTVTAGGTAGDIKAGSVRVHGTNYADEEIYEDFTFTVGTGSGLGLPFKFASKPLFIASFDGTSDAGTITADDDEVEKNIYTSHSSLNGKVIKLALVM